MTETSHAEYTIPDAVTVSGASWRQIHHWIQRGYLNTSRGKGWAHLLSDVEVAVAGTMVDLIDAGFTPRSAAIIARSMVVNGHGDLTVSATVRISHTSRRAS